MDRFRRRCVVAAGALLCAPPFAGERVARVAFLYFGSRRAAQETGRYAAFTQGLRELGYVDGRNLALDARFADGSTERLAPLVAEVVRSRPDVVVATGSQVYRALLAAGSPAVVVTVNVDPVADGLAKSLAHPGGRFTGLTDTAGQLGPKHVELLDSVVPRLARVAVLFNPDNTSHGWQFESIERAARSLGKQALAVRARSAGEVETGFADMAAQGAQAVIIFGDTLFTAQLRRMAELALAARLPSAHPAYPFAEAGGLLAYGADLTDNFRRAATFVDKIVKGARPGDLPFEQPTQYELVINLRTAKALGLALPQSLLLRADRLVQ
jgi:putative tryptophan/tyrosine transport system substrate-binding protein